MPGKRRAIFICLLLAAVTLAVYWPATRFEFINYDDPDYVSYNPIVEHGITRAGLIWAFTTGHASNWHPLTWITHMADCQIYGPKSGGHHLTNLLLHAANVVMLFLVLFQLTRSQWRSALVAALFAWHPLHVESVAWVSERKDVLCAFFWLLTIAAYAQYASARKGGDAASNSKSKIFYVLALVCFALALLSKPMAVTLPCTLLLLDFWPLRRIADCRLRIADSEDVENPARKSVVKVVVEKIPFFILAALDCFATFWAQRGGNSVVSQAVLPASERISNALVSYVLYLWKMIWPMDLALPYPYSNQWSWPTALGAGVLLLMISAVSVFLAPRKPYLIVGWLWFLGTLVPVIGLVQVGSQFMADRYSYIPLIGIFIMIAWAIPAGWARWPRPGLVSGTAVVAVMMFLIAGTETQLQYWRNSVTLFGHTVQVTRDNILAEYNLAQALAERGDEDDAIAHYQKAIAITPNRVEAQYNSQLQAHYNLGLIYRVRKDWTAAEAQFRSCLQDDPNLAMAHANLGTALIGLKRDAEGVKEFEIAARLESSTPQNTRLLVSIESAYAETGRFADAAAYAQKVHDAALAEGHPEIAAAADKRLASYREKKL